MPKVTLPLGSSEAHGRVGQSFIFQGNTVKAYAKPVIKKVQGQITAQDKFQAVTRTFNAMGAWGRAALPSMLGSNWFALMVKECTDNWTDLESVYSGFSSNDKEQWSIKAPYQVGAFDAGLTFYICANAIRILGLRVQIPFIPEIVQYGGTSYAAEDFWAQTLDGVLGSGKIDDDDIGFQYIVEGAAWNVVESEQAFGGSYHETSAGGSNTLKFYFIGSSFSLIHKKSLSGGLVRVTIDTFSHTTFSQNEVDTQYQALWQSPQLTKGLHIIFVHRSGISGLLNFDGLIVHG